MVPLHFDTLLQPKNCSSRKTDLLGHKLQRGKVILGTQQSCGSAIVLFFHEAVESKIGQLSQKLHWHRTIQRVSEWFRDVLREAQKGQDAPRRKKRRRQRVS